MNKPSFGRFYVNEIPDNVKQLESTRAFHTLVRFFIREKKKDYPECGYNPCDVVWNTQMARDFENFVLKMSLTGRLQIKENLYDRLDELKKNVKERCYYTIRTSTILYDDIVKYIFIPEGKYKSHLDVKKQMLRFNTAYHMMKETFYGIVRESKDKSGRPERYFEHLKEAAKIVLYELPNPNIDKIIIALLHDVIEDIPGITYEYLKTMFGDHIALGVEKLSKNDWRYNLTDTEKEELDSISEENNRYQELKDLGEYKKIQALKNNGNGQPSGLIRQLSKRDWRSYLEDVERYEIKCLEESRKRYNELKTKGKDRRNKEYFGHMDELLDDYLDVKFADRIHNLRTLESTSIEKIIKKIIETEKYFMDLAWARKQKRIKEGMDMGDGRRYAYDILKTELDRLKLNHDILVAYNRAKQGVSIK